MYSGSSFMGVGKINREVKCQIVAVSKVVQVLDQTNVAKKKKKLSWKRKFSTYLLSYITFT